MKECRFEGYIKYCIFHEREIVLKLHFKPLIPFYFLGLAVDFYFAGRLLSGNI